jgi:Tol biopolymer transport system component
LIQRCLAKDRRHRAGDISVAQFVLTEAPSLAASNAAGVKEHDPTSVQRQVEKAVATARREMIWRRMLPVTAAGIVLAATVGGVGGWIVNRSPSKPVARFSLTLPDGQQFTNTGRHLVAISPDGTQLVYVANNRLYLRSVSDLEARAIPGTETKEGILDPVFSPDGDSLAFFQPRVGARADSNGTLKRIAVSGGVAVTICPAEGVFGMTWDASGIVFGQRRGIFRCPSGGGSPEQLATVKADELAHGPQILPGGQALIFTVARAGDGVERWDKAQVVVQSLTSGARKTLINGGSDARYLVTGHLLYALRGIVFAVPFDPTRQEITGGPVAVVEGVRRAINATTGVAHLDTSGTGSLVYIPGPPDPTTTERAVAVADRAGAVTRLAPPAGPFIHTRASRDGDRIAVDGDDGKEAIVWIYELAGTSAMRRLTFGGKNRFPIWSPDGQRVAFQSDREGDLAIFTQRADGSGSVERLTTPEQGGAHVPESWSPDGRYISFSLVKGSTFSLWTLPVEDKQSAPFGGVQSNEPIGSVFSPDGRWIAYHSLPPGSRFDSPNSGVFIQPFPATGARYQVPKLQSDFQPVWSPDGTELLYVPFAASGQLAAVRVSTQSGVTFGSPRSLPASYVFQTVVYDASLRHPARRQIHRAGFRPRK